MVGYSAPDTLLRARSLEANAYFNWVCGDHNGQSKSRRWECMYGKLHQWHTVTLAKAFVHGRLAEHSPLLSKLWCSNSTCYQQGQSTCMQKT
jgi:hypothetical protein